MRTEDQLKALIENENAPVQDRWNALMEYEGCSADDCGKKHSTEYMLAELNDAMVVF